jgi:hypothetical protein
MLQEDGPMHYSKLIAASFAVAALAIAASAHAEFGAVALEEGTGKYGVAWNQTNQKQADEAATKDCAATGCKVVFRLASKQCGAIAMTEDGKVWGGAKRPAKAAAELAAIQNCQKRTKVQCTIKSAECNR